MDAWKQKAAEQAELRNEALDANSFVNNSTGKPRALDRKQNYAFSFGGPVYIPKVYHGQNKSFFYVSYERYRERRLRRAGVIAILKEIQKATITQLDRY